MNPAPCSNVLFVTGSQPIYFHREMNSAAARELLLSTNDVSEHDHFGRGAYRVARANGKPSNIFATLWIEDNRVVLMLDQEQQADLHARHPEVFFPVPNKWGEKGATFVELAALDEQLFMRAVAIARSNVSG